MKALIMEIFPCTQFVGGGVSSQCIDNDNDNDNERIFIVQIVQSRSYGFSSTWHIRYADSYVKDKTVGRPSYL